MDSEMVERVAMALRESWLNTPGSDWVACARVAILAMRKPTEEMLCAGGLAQTAWEDRYNGGNARKVWEAMIDNALIKP